MHIAQVCVLCFHLHFRACATVHLKFVRTCLQFRVLANAKRSISSTDSHDSRPIESMYVAPSRYPQNSKLRVLVKAERSFSWRERENKLHQRGASPPERVRLFGHGRRGHLPGSQLQLSHASLLKAPQECDPLPVGALTQNERVCWPQRTWMRPQLIGETKSLHSLGLPGERWRGW